MSFYVGKESYIRNRSIAGFQPQANNTTTVIAATNEPRVKKRSTRRAVSATSIVSYIGIFLLIITFVAVSYRPPERKVNLASAGQLASTESAKNGAVAGDVDQLLATNIGANLADSTDLPVANNVANLSQSLTAESMLAQSDANTVSKPLVQNVVAPNATFQYVTVAGDTVPAIAAKFNVSAQTVRWANNLASDALEPGKTLTIPSKNGVLYTVKSGDTVDSVANRYKTDAQLLILDNNIDPAVGLPVGQQLILADGTLPTEEQPGYVAPRTAAASRATTSGSSYSGANTGFNSNLAASVGNKYAWGNCTWYAYERRAQLGNPVGSFWGNASTWAYNARLSGFRVDYNPEAGAVMANGGGYGHVAIVESVNIGVSVHISEMNAYRWGGGFNRIDYGDIPWSEAVSGNFQYIH